MGEVSLRKGIGESSGQGLQDLPADLSPAHGLCKARCRSQPHRGRPGGLMQVEQKPGQVRVLQLGHCVDDGSSTGTLAAFFEERQQQGRVGMVVLPVSKDGSSQTHDFGILTVPEQGPHPLHLADLAVSCNHSKPLKIGWSTGQRVANGDAAKEQGGKQTCCPREPLQSKSIGQSVVGHERLMGLLRASTFQELCQPAVLGSNVGHEVIGDKHVCAQVDLL